MPKLPTIPKISRGTSLNNHRMSITWNHQKLGLRHMLACCLPFLFEKHSSVSLLSLSLSSLFIMCDNSKIAQSCQANPTASLFLTRLPWRPALACDTLCVCVWPRECVQESTLDQVGIDRESVCVCECHSPDTPHRERRRTIAGLTVHD